MRKGTTKFRRNGCQLAMALLVMLAWQNLAASDPTTQPSSPAEQMWLWIRQLGADDAVVRQNALTQLMGLHRDDLPMLREVAFAQEPLLPGQIAAIHDAVTHVYLANQRDPQAPADITPATQGFLGLRWPLDDVSRPGGVIVSQRIPGFNAYRLLQSGDIIVKLIDQPNVRLDDSTDFINAVRPLRAGQALRMQIMRYGRLMDISIVLNSYPSELPEVITDPTMLDEWIQARAEKAQSYWNEEFSIIDPNHSITASTEP